MKNEKRIVIDMDQAIRYFKMIELNSRDDAEKMRDEAIEVVTHLRDLLFELDSLELDLVNGLLEYYGIKL